MAEGFCSFFELKSFLFEFYFFELSLFESSIGSMMINTISPGSQGSLAASRPSTAASPRAAVAGRDLAILPRQQGEIVYIHHSSHEIATQTQTVIPERAGWEARLTSIEFRKECKNVHGPHSDKT